MKPPYAMIPNRSIGLGPYVQTNGHLHTFCVDGDIDKIDAFLDKMFKIPSGGAVDYEAATSTLFVSFAYFPSVRATNPADNDRGVLPESDAAIWALARKRGTLFDFAWIPLFLFVDDGSAMNTGREVYGFPKQYGRFEMPTGPAPADGPFRVSATVLNPFSHNTVSTVAPIFEFTRQGAAAASITGSVEEVVAGIFTRLAGRLRSGAEGLAAALGGGFSLFTLPVKMAFLKQFPDTADPTKACFQSIVEAKAKTLQVHSAGWTGASFRGQVFSYDSHPFHDALGVPTGQVPVGAALWANFDFEMELGKDVWKAVI